jgi:hypothetical protein
MIVLVNHYNRPGFQAWWIALLVSFALPFDLHWVVTSGWVYDDALRSLTITPVSRWLLRRISNSYGFTTMPPMPPREEQTEQRAAAVRALIQHVQTCAQPLIGFAPEGSDSSTGQLQRPPEGVGRLLAYFASQGINWLPVGVYEEDGELCLNVGPLIAPEMPDRRQPELDKAIADQAMRALSTCLPSRLHGPYSTS